MAQGAKNLTAAAQIAVEVQVRFPSGSSGIQCCCSCGVDHSCSLDSAPGPGTFLCRGFSHEEEKEEGGGGGGEGGRRRGRRGRRRRAGKERALQTASPEGKPPQSLGPAAYWRRNIPGRAPAGGATPAAAHTRLPGLLQEADLLPPAPLSLHHK